MGEHQVEALVYYDLNIHKKPKNKSRNYFKRIFDMTSIENLQYDIKKTISKNEGIPEDIIAIEEMIHYRNKKGQKLLEQSSDILLVLAGYKSNATPVKLGVVWSTSEATQHGLLRGQNERFINIAPETEGQDWETTAADVKQEVTFDISKESLHDADDNDMDLNHTVEVQVFDGIKEDSKKLADKNRFFFGRVNSTSMESLKASIVELISCQTGVGADVVDIAEIYLYAPRKAPQPVLNNFDAMKISASYNAKPTPVRLGVNWCILQSGSESEQKSGEKSDAAMQASRDKSSSESEESVDGNEDENVDVDKEKYKIIIFDDLDEKKHPKNYQRSWTGNVCLTNLDSLRSDVSEIIAVNRGIPSCSVETREIYFYNAPVNPPHQVVNTIDVLRALAQHKVKNIVQFGVIWDLIDPENLLDSISEENDVGMSSDDEKTSSEKTDKIEKNGASDFVSLKKSLFGQEGQMSDMYIPGVEDEDVVDIIVYENLSKSKRPQDVGQYFTGKARMTNLQMFRVDLRRLISHEIGTAVEHVQVDEIYHYANRKPAKLITQECELIRILSNYRFAFEELRFGVLWKQSVNSSERNTKDGERENMEAPGSDYTRDAEKPGINDIKDTEKPVLSDNRHIEKLGLRNTREIETPGSSYTRDVETASIHFMRDEQTVDINTFGGDEYLSKQQQEVISIKQEPVEEELCAARCQREVQMTSHDLLSGINDLWVKDICCDLELVCEGQVVVKGHRVILAAGSQYFQEPHFHSTSRIIYEFDKTPAEIMRIVVEFLYGNAIILTQDNTHKILELAEKLSIGKLVDGCKSIVSDRKKDSENKASKTEERKMDEKEIDIKKRLPENSTSSPTRRKISLRSNRNAEKRRMEIKEEEDGEVLEKTAKLEEDNEEWISTSERKCKKSKSAKKDKLNKHKITMKKFECANCDEKFKLKRDLKSHEVESHPDAKVTCTKTFKSSLCDICLVAVRLNDLVFHKMRRHGIGLLFATEIKCCHCDDVFKFKEEFKIHMKDVHKKDVEYCQEDDCVQIFDLSDVASINSHAVQAHGKTNMRCQFCDFKTPFYKTLWRHSVKLHRKVKCTLCEKEYGWREWKRIYSHLLRQHKVVPERSELKECRHCDYQHYQGSSLLSHIRLSHKSAPVTCHKCGKQFKHNHSLQAHYQVCGRKTAYVCSFCGKQFTYKMGLKKHERKDHEVALPDFQCSHCNYATDERLYFENHMFSKHRIISEGRTVFTCEFCAHQTIDKHMLDNHIKTVHTEEKVKTTCEVCGLVLSSKAGYKSHKQVHEHPELKPYPCFYPECTYQARYQGNLGQHLLSTHLMRGEKPFQCAHCSYRSGIKGNVTKHIEVQHRGSDVKVHRLWESPSQHDINWYLNCNKQYDPRSLEEFVKVAVEKKKKERVTPEKIVDEREPVNAVSGNERIKGEGTSE